MHVVLPYGRGERLDSYLSRVVGIHSRSEWRRLIEAGAVTIDSRVVRPSIRLRGGEHIYVRPLPSHMALEPQPEIPLDIVYADDQVIVVNKQPGLVVHPAPGHERGTLVNALLARFPELRDPTGQLRPGIVHRLDKDTSGLMVVGKTPEAVARLQDQFKRRTAVKRYLLLVCGTIAEDEGLIDAPIARDPFNRKKMAARADGKPAETRFRVLERIGGYTLVEAQIHTGRTHQLRVHFAYIGHPVAGDAVYGRCRVPGLDRQFVHSAYLRITSPATGRPLEFHVPLPDDLRRVLESLHQKTPSG